MPLTLSRLIATVALVILVDFPSASAIPVSGSIDYQGDLTVLVRLTGDQFTFVGSIDGLATTDPMNACGRGNTCLPGATLTLTGAAFGPDVRGAAVWQGMDYEACGRSHMPCVYPTLGMSAMITVPALGAETLATITAPASFDGASWLFFDAAGGSRAEPVTANATATVTLVQHDIAFIPALGPGWYLQEIRYDLAPTAEPGTLLLLASGAAGLGWVARRRRGGSPRTE